MNFEVNYSDGSYKRYYDNSFENVDDIININFVVFESLDFQSIPVMSNLKEINLEMLGLNEFPDWLFNSKKLEVLKLSKNYLSVLPSRIQEFENLKFLDIEHNNFNILPEEIKNLRNLEFLNYSYNNFFLTVS